MYKKILVFALSALLILFCVSCKGTGDPDISRPETGRQEQIGEDTDRKKYAVVRDDIDFGLSDGDYIFNAASTRVPGYNVLLKYNVHTGECSPVCPDPFCDHASESCEFYDVIYATYIGNTVYFVKTNRETGKRGIYGFDVDSVRGEFVYETDGYLERIFAYKGYIYFTDGNVIKLDAATHKSTVLFQPYGSIFMVRNDLIYTSFDDSTDDMRLYDLDGNLVAEHALDTKYGGYVYSIHPKNDELGNPWIMDVMRTNDTDLKYYPNSRRVIYDEKWEMVYENLGPITCLSDRILFFVAAPVEEMCGLRLFRGVGTIMPDGSDKRVLLEYDDSISTTLTSEARYNEMICGDYIGIYMLPEKPVGDDENVGRCDLLLLNYKTGDYKISRFEYEVPEAFKNQD